MKERLRQNKNFIQLFDTIQTTLFWATFMLMKIKSFEKSCRETFIYFHNIYVDIKLDWPSKF